ncbi:MAG: dihydrodipicolinate reductase [Bacteroidetes bacterium SB0662_bin_6]|nr:dihydrodipicolinate reductase [Bacteroidetes bacterium SB0668_bin_1]MYE04946.1 dihydrodipicolinate reductase [Bacteroidetes bacterium SB0662_bin_6]
MSSPVRVLQYGVGPIGLACIRSILTKQETGQLVLAGAVDIAPEKTGRDVAELLGGDLLPTGIVVREDAVAALAETTPDVVLHTTSSFLDHVHGQIEECIHSGVPVVSSTEELAFSYDRHPERSAALHKEAVKHGVAVVGTGVNPGYAMDTLALMATGVCCDVSEVHAVRVVDAGKRRMPLQVKVGAGLSVKAFEEKKATGAFGHIGLRESLFFVAKGLGWPLDRVDEQLHPVLAEAEVSTPFLTVAPGSVAGIHHSITGYVGGKPLLSLDLKMFVGAEEPRDAVRVVGDPPVDLVVRGGIFGDTATVAALINAIPLVMHASPGLKTMMDLPVPRAFACSPNSG